MSELEHVSRIAVYVLGLNDMRSGQIENTSPACWAASEAEMEEFIASQTVDGYRTHGKWAKCYREGGILEWFNSPFHGFGQGVQRFIVEDVSVVAHIPRVYGAQS